MKRKKAVLLRMVMQKHGYSTRDDGIIVSCRGTEPICPSDILADLKYILRHPCNGRVHRGFYDYTMLVFPKS